MALHDNFVNRIIAIAITTNAAAAAAAIIVSCCIKGSPSLQGSKHCPHSKLELPFCQRWRPARWRTQTSARHRRLETN
jgi:hypothetical protein